MINEQISISTNRERRFGDRVDFEDFFRDFDLDDERCFERPPFSASTTAGDSFRVVGLKSQRMNKKNKSEFTWLISID